MNEVLKLDNDALILEKFKVHEHFSKCLLDAYAIINNEGRVLKCNALLSQITGMTTKQIVRATNINDVMDFQLGDHPLHIGKILEHKEPARIDEIKVVSFTGREATCILGIFPFIENNIVIGTFILMRDVTAETQLQDKYKDKATQSITDRLTGLYNRGYFDDYLLTQEKQLLQLPANSEHRKMSLVIFDIDFFKKINDVHGHLAGDFIIKHVSKILFTSFRKTDIICRYGGEEFLVILPASHFGGTAVAADKARKNIESYVFEFDNKIIPVTISAGVAQVLVGSETTKDTIGRADAALYHSKHNGRNRVSIHDGETISGGEDIILKFAQAQKAA